MSKNKYRLLISMSNQKQIKFIIGDDQIKLAEIVEEAIKSPVVSMSSRLFEDLLTEAVQSLGKWAYDIEYLDNGQLVVSVWGGLEIYDDNGQKIDHYLSHNCKPVDDGGLWGVLWEGMWVTLW
ncbi:hypothetical protein LSH36_941g00040 [Paralvinella palmiformis]|uniref:Uncharacterized protein n=1 Tax=Paralvinella palmiformis TaxID=53620 RepID=A0AAD9MQT8_9ANNE|nr:hypothetical protein LSH36_941g00040 [Paralvinella palmiformis]